MWFYSLPTHDRLCRTAESIYKDYLGAARFGNIFSLDVGPDYAGQLREIDVETLRQVGKFIRGEAKAALPVSLFRETKASGVWQDQAAFAAGAATDGNPATRWGAPEKSRDGWLEIDLGTPTTVDHVVIDEGDWNRVRKFVLECQEGEKWKALAEGTTIGPKKIIRFPATKARVFRLRILEAVEVPTLPEVELWAAP